MRNVALAPPESRRPKVAHLLRAQQTETSNKESKDITETGGKVSDKPGSAGPLVPTLAICICIGILR